MKRPLFSLLLLISLSTFLTAQTNNPGAREGHSLVFQNGSLYLFGGVCVESSQQNSVTLKSASFAGDVKNDLHEFGEGEVWGETADVNPPSIRQEHTATPMPDGRTIVLFGNPGDGSDYLRDGHIFDPETNHWEQITFSGTVPNNCSRHCAVVINNNLYNFGGITKYTCDGITYSGYSNDLFTLDLATNTWEYIPVMGNDVPPPTYGASMVAYNGKLYLFCGKTNDGYSNKAYAFDPATTQWAQLTSLPGDGRYKVQATVNEENGKITVWGGGSSTDRFNERWMYNVLSDDWSQGTIPDDVDLFASKASTDGQGNSWFYGGQDETYALKDDFYKVENEGEQDEVWKKYNYETSSWKTPGVRNYTLTVSTSPTEASTSLCRTDPSGTSEHEDGADVELYAYPAAGWEFTGWTGDASSTESWTVVNVYKDMNVVANFRKKEIYLLDLYINPAQAERAGCITSPSGVGNEYEEGTSVSISTTGVAGWDFVGWQGDASGMANPLSITMDKEVIGIVAMYTPSTVPSFTLTTGINPATATNEGCSVSPSGAPIYEENTVVPITATAAAGWTFTSWTGAPGGSTSSIVMTENKNIIANFERDGTTKTLITGVVPDEASTQGCSVTGGGQYPTGTTASVTANSAAGWYFCGWAGNISGGENASIVMDDNKWGNAHFKKGTVPFYALNVSSSPIAAKWEGCTTSPSGTSTHVPGTTVTVFADAGDGWKFKGWTGAASGSVGHVTVTLNEPNTNLTAIFEKDGEQVTLTSGISPTEAANAGCNVNPSGTSTHDFGTTVELQATAANGWFFKEWQGGVIGGNPGSITMDENKSITAVFEEGAQREFSLKMTISPSDAETDGCSSSPSGITSYPEGSSVSVKATAIPGWKFVDWSGSVTGGNPGTVLMNETQNVTANFERTAHYITVFPDTAEIIYPDSAQFKATAFDINNNPMSASFEWVASVGDVNSNGLFHPDSIDGTATITATETKTGASNLGKAIVQLNTGISSKYISKGKILIFPNPVLEILYFETSQGTTFFDFRIIDVSGRHLINRKNYGTNSIDVTSLTPGIYFIQIKNGNDFYTEKFIKN